MKNFVLDFMNNYLIIVIFSLFMLIALSFKFKKIRYFLISMIFLVLTSLGIYQLHLLDVLDTKLYEYTCEFVCLLMHTFEVLVSLTFKIEGNIFNRVDYNNFIGNIVYSLSILSKIDVNFSSLYLLFIYIFNIYKNFKNILKKKVLTTFSGSLYKINLIKSKTVMNC